MMKDVKVEREKVESPSRDSDMLEIVSMFHGRICSKTKEEQKKKKKKTPTVDVYLMILIHALIYNLYFLNDDLHPQLNMPRKIYENYQYHALIYHMM